MAASAAWHYPDGKRMLIQPIALNMGSVKLHCPFIMNFIVRKKNMTLLSKWFLQGNDSMKEIEHRGKTHIYFKLNGIMLKFPSRSYPLAHDNPEIFSRNNTRDCTDQKILDVYNSITPKYGRYWENTMTLYCRLIEAGIPLRRIRLYEGYQLNTLFYGPPLPHSFVVIDEKYAFDFVWVPREKNYDKFIPKGKDPSIRTNADKYTYGRLPMQVVYVACSVADDELKPIDLKHARDIPFWDDIPAMYPDGDTTV